MSKNLDNGSIELLYPDCDNDVDVTSDWGESWGVIPFEKLRDWVLKVDAELNTKVTPSCRKCKRRSGGCRYNEGNFCCFKAFGLK